MNSVHPFPRTAGLYPEPEWADPERVWHLSLCCWAPILHCSAHCQIREIFCPAILLSITYCISTLLVSFKHQECCQTMYFQFEIWMSKNAIKWRMFYINRKTLKKIPLQKSQLNWYSYVRNKCLWEKSYTHLDKKYTYFWSLNLFWQRFWIKTAVSF